METEIINKSSGRKWTFIILLILIVLFIIYYAVMSVMAPARTLAAIKNEYNNSAAVKNVTDEKILSDSTYLKLLKEKSFLQSRIIMAETDSIYLTINLSDSTANIEICGVAVHKVKMSELKASKILLKGNENVILSMLASPFTISKSYATIKKEPVMIKTAPKDTSEYKPDIMPDTSITEPVNYILEMTDGTRIYVYQEEKEKYKDIMSLFNFEIKDRLHDIWISMKNVLLFKVPEYHLYIKMWIPRSDAKIIYRAIPKNGQVGIYR